MSQTSRRQPRGRRASRAALLVSTLLVSSFAASLAGHGAAEAKPRAKRKPVAAAPAAAAQPVKAKAKAAAATSLDEVTVTASRGEEKAIDSMSATTVVSRDELQRENPTSLSSVLNQIPGVSTQMNANEPAIAINIRGLQDFGRVAVTVDGARQNFQRSGHNANGAFYLDPAFIRSIDVTRGPVANVYGSGAIGGVVSFRTVDPTDILRENEKWAGEVTTSGSVGNWRGGDAAVLGAVRPAGWVAALAGVSFQRRDSYHDGSGATVADTDRDVNAFLGKVELTPGEGHRLVLGGQIQKYDYTNGTTSRYHNDVKTDQFTARYTFSRPDLNWVNLTVGAYTTATYADQTRLSTNPAQYGNWRYFNIRTTGFDISNVSKFDVGPVNLKFTYGGDFFQDKVTTLDPYAGGDKYTPGGRRSVYGGFLQGALKWAMFDAVAGFRYDSYSMTGATASSSGNRLSPKFTLGVTPIEGLQFYGTYAEGYRAPSITETLVNGLHPSPAAFTFVPNPNLRPEVGKTLEGGVNVKYNDILFDGDTLRMKASVYKNDVSNFIDGVYTDPTGTCGAPAPWGNCSQAYYTYRNVASARLRGVEGELVYDARRWFASISGSLTRGDNLTDHIPLLSVYPDKVTLGGGVRFLDEKLVVSGRLNFVSEQRRLYYTNYATYSASYQLVDLDASYNFTQDARAFVNLRNIGNRRYKPYMYSSYDPGFTAKFGFSARFGT